MSSESLKHLRQLTETLCVRDQERAEELKLYNLFFENIPIKTFVWTALPDMCVLIKNRKSIKDQNILTNGSIVDAFTCPVMNNKNVQHHTQAFAGESQTYISYENNETFLTTLIPEAGKSGIDRVHGCSWDITHLCKMITALELGSNALMESSPELAKTLQNVVDNAPLVQLIIKLLKED